MYFDSFDICVAHFLFACHYHGGQNCRIYRKFSKLERLRFTPSLCQSDRPADLAANTKEIYRQLVVKFHGLHSTAPD